MRIWHKDLIPVLPRQQLLGQWRELHLIMKNISEKCTPGHILVNRMIEFPVEHTWRYIALVGQEMSYRKYKVNSSKIEKYFSMDDLKKQHKIFGYDVMLAAGQLGIGEVYWSWHNDRYLRECLMNLEEKAICGGISEDEWKPIVDKFGDRFDLWRGNNLEHKYDLWSPKRWIK